MQVDDIRVFIPSKNYKQSKLFYEALGFSKKDISSELSLFENGDCSFFLQRFYNQTLAENLMLQLSVTDINEAFEAISNLPFPTKHSSIKIEVWGKVIHLWGPSEELWHVTEFNK